MYYKRLIDNYLMEWAASDEHKPLLLRGARQVGKSSAVRHLGETFDNYIEINFEEQPRYKAVFQEDLDVNRIVSMISVYCGKVIKPGKTLLFLDEIQECQEAIMSLRFFKEQLPGLHVVAAGSLLEFALQDLPTFGVGRIHSMFMYPMSFDEFLMANGNDSLLIAKQEASKDNPLPELFHQKLVALFRTFLLVGGMPEVVAKWVKTHDYLKCQEIQDDILLTYEDDFGKYKKRVDPILMRLTLRSVAAQVTKKFVYSQVSTEYKVEKIKNAVEMLVLAGILYPVTNSSANGLPLGCEADDSCRKMLLLDTGLLLRLLDMTFHNAKEMAAFILSSKESDLVNKGVLTEMFVGLEMLRYKKPTLRHELYYWLRKQKSSLSEVDYLEVKNMKVLPIEVKASTQGGMKSLWIMMREKKLDSAVRCSLENFSHFDYTDSEDDNAIRHIDVFPLYAVAEMLK